MRIKLNGVGHAATTATPRGGRAGLLRRPVENDNAAMDAEPKRKRRWYQFSMRTLLIGVTLFGVACAYVAREARIVNRRLAYLKANPFQIDESPDGFHKILAKGDPDQAPKGIRLWLGDWFQLIVVVNKGTSPEEARDVAALFPEARIVEGEEGTRPNAAKSTSALSSHYQLVHPLTALAPAAP